MHAMLIPNSWICRRSDCIIRIISPPLPIDPNSSKKLTQYPRQSLNEKQHACMASHTTSKIHSNFASVIVWVSWNCLDLLPGWLSLLHNHFSSELHSCIIFHATNWSIHLSWIHTQIKSNAKHFFITLSHSYFHFMVFEVMSV